MKRYSLDILFIAMIIDIVCFVNMYTISNELFQLLFYLPIFFTLWLFFKNAWGCALKTKKEKLLRRTLISALGFYFVFVLITKVIAVINYDLYKLIYRGKYINYSLASGMGFGLLVYPLIIKIKEWLKK